MLEPLDDALLPNDISLLDEQIEELEKRQKLCNKHIAELMAQERPYDGVVFAADIHAAKQLKAMLLYQHAVRVAKKNRLTQSPA